MRKKDPFLQAKMQRAQASSVQANLRPGKPQLMLADAATAEGTPTGSPRSIRLLALRHPFQLVPRSPMYLSVHPLAARSRLRIIRTRNTIGRAYAHAHRVECLYASCHPPQPPRAARVGPARAVVHGACRGVRRLVYIRRRCGCMQTSTRAGRSIVSPSSTRAVRSTLAAWLK
jgi:hypothetical protein